jgi:[acyl-carrier-protein] S-malonyltransferase
LLLPVSVPSHCALMKPAADAFAAELAATDFRVPEIPVMHNVDVSVKDNVDAIRAALAAQLYQPVRWVDTIRTMHAAGIARVVEMGPGKVLAGLNKRIEQSMPGLAVQTPADLDQVLAELG